MALMLLAKRHLRDSQALTNTMLSYDETKIGLHILNAACYI